MNKCANCGVHACYDGTGTYPDGCPSLEHEITSESLRRMLDSELDMKIALAAAKIEAAGYCKITRIEETVNFMKEMGYKKIGLAFCFGLRKEARILQNILTSHGFSTETIICKNGGFDKQAIGIEETGKIRSNCFEAMCNPVGQAIHLAEAKTDFNLILGLCVGHDTLFIKHSKSPVSVIAVKDRVLCHNPLGAIYSAEGYYKDKLYGDKG